MRGSLLIKKFAVFNSRIHQGWVYVDIYKGKLDSAFIVQTTKPAGAIKQILVFQRDELAVIGFKLNKSIESSEIYQDPTSLDLILTLRPTVSNKPKVNSSIKESLDKEKEKWRIDRIVLDAGHGGKDPGSIGRSGTKEKDITLDVVKRLGKILEKKSKMSVVYTRKSDVFVPLHERTKIANRENGKLFISIHCNSNKVKQASGFETYILRPGKTEDAIRVAERENAAVKYEEDGFKYEDLTAENFILATMAQSAFVKESENFSALIQQELDRKLDTKNRGVKQAGFYVLIGASMPNVLIELGFISNPYEEKLLRTKKHRQRLAESIYDGIIKFKQRYETGFF